MEIGPILGIRPVAPVAPRPAAPDLSGVFAVEFRKQDQDATYTSSQKASRGLEEENEDNDFFEAESGDSGLPSSQISFFA